jgi:phosphoribosyl 1,2-cyclic phosphodiesterase
MKIKFWGTRGSIAVPGKQTIRYGGNTTCLEITLGGGGVVVIDAGSGIRALGDKLASENEKIDIHLLVTHIHWDHVLGFPYFAPLYKKTSNIRIDGYPTCVKGLRNTFDNKMGDGFFPVKFADLKAGIRYLEVLQHRPLEIDGTRIDAIPLHHPQGGFGFRFMEEGKVFVFLTDNELGGETGMGDLPGTMWSFAAMQIFSSMTPSSLPGRSGSAGTGATPTTGPPSTWPMRQASRS